MKSKKGISIPLASALSFSSIIGAGVIFVPREIHAIAQGYDVAVMISGFVLSIVMCVMIASLSFGNGRDGMSLPRILESSLEGIHASFAPGLMSLALLLGLPVAALYAAEIISLFIPWLGDRKPDIAGLILTAALLVNLFESRLSSMVQAVIVGAICLACILLFHEIDTPHTMMPSGHTSLSSLATAMLMSILAFAGLENMPSISSSFRGGKKSFFFAMLIGSALSLAVYLTVLLLVRTQPDGPQMSSVSWLMPSDGTSVTLRIAAILMVLAVFANIITWNIGMTATWMELLQQSSSRSRMLIQCVTAGGYLVVLGLIFSGTVRSQHAVAQAGAIFGSIYILLAVACIRRPPDKIIRWLALGLMVIMTIILALNPIYLLLPVAVLGVAGLSASHRKRRMQP